MAEVTIAEVLFRAVPGTHAPDWNRLHGSDAAIDALRDVCHAQADALTAYLGFVPTPRASTGRHVLPSS